MRTAVIGIAMMVAVCIASTPLLAQNKAAAKKPAVDPAKRQVFFGEQHLHTANSVDAFAMATRNTVDDAYSREQDQPAGQNSDRKIDRQRRRNERLGGLPDHHQRHLCWRDDPVKIGAPVPDGTPLTIQERVWSSPIWHTPDPKLVKKPDFYPGLQQYLQ